MPLGVERGFVCWTDFVLLRRTEVNRYGNVNTVFTARQVNTCLLFETEKPICNMTPACNNGGSYCGILSVPRAMWSVLWSRRRK